MVFCYSDVWLDNFILGKDGSISIVDFADTSFLPLSFTRFDLLGTPNKINYDISRSVSLPTTTGVDNTRALVAVAGPTYSDGLIFIC